MGYKSITIKGKGKDRHTFVGMYVGKFERIGTNQLKKVDELRTSKGSQLRKSFQLWHTQRNQYILKILNQFSQWQVLTLDSVDEVRKWLGNDEMYDDLARYAAQIRDLEAYALPRIENLSKFKKQKVRSEKWRKPYEKPKSFKATDDYYLGDHDQFTPKLENDGAEIDKGDISFFGFDADMIEKFAQAAKNKIEEKKKLIKAVDKEQNSQSS